MLTKRQRIATWLGIALLTVFGSGFGEFVGEVILPGSLFHKISSYMFGGGVLLGGLAILLTILSLTLSDWQESQNTNTFISLGRDDRIISMQKIGDAIVNLPISGTTHKSIIARNKNASPYVSHDCAEHIHISSPIPATQVMDEDLYQKLFGQSD